MDEKDNISFENSKCCVGDDPIIDIYFTYTKLNDRKLRTKGFIFFAQRWLLCSPPNYDKAFNLWLKASEIYTNPIVLYNMGVHYYLGKGITQDLEMACDLFEQAAIHPINLSQCRNFGVRESCIALAKCYEEGKGRDKNLELADEWYLNSKRCPCGCNSGDKHWDIVRELYSIDFLLHYGRPYAINCNTKLTKLFWYHEKEIRLNAEKMKLGFSADLLDAMNYFSHTLFATCSYFADHAKFAENVDIVQQEIIHLIANSLRRTPYGVPLFKKKDWPKLGKVFDCHITQPLDDMTNRSILDRDARVCKAMEMLQRPDCKSFDKNRYNNYFHFFKHSVFKYPEELIFFQFIVNLSVRIEKLFGIDVDAIVDSSINAVLKASKNFPNDMAILEISHKITVDIVMRHKDDKFDSDIYWDLIDNLDPDHHIIPELFYLLAKWEADSGNLKMCRCYYNQGIDAERNILSFFLPYKSMTKKIVKESLESSDYFNVFQLIGFGTR